MTHPFIIIEPYQFEGDIAFGVWDEREGLYMIGDGDGYAPDYLDRMWGDAVTRLTWSEVEARLKAAKP